jgi:uncharacterized membrane protein YeaQ/YmgE (transglycosylase-associated protein family)
MNLVYTLAIGGIAGWLASSFMKGKGMGIVMNIILGILGAIVGSFLFPFLGILLGIEVTGEGLLGAIVKPTIGAIIVLYLAKSLAKK